MIRALRGDNIEEPAEPLKAESRMAVVTLGDRNIYRLLVAGYILEVNENYDLLIAISDHINAEVDKRCREAVKAELDRLIS